MHVIFDSLLSELTEDDFKISHEYTIKSVYTKPSGKWNELTADALFLDSTKFFSVYEKLIHKKLLEVVKK
jgi:hypothetical protein